jgi:hypothetical protein
MVHKPYPVKLKASDSRRKPPMLLAIDEKEVLLMDEGELEPPIPGRKSTVGIFSVGAPDVVIRRSK